MMKTHRILKHSALCLSISAILPACQITVDGNSVDTAGTTDGSNPSGNPTGVTPTGTSGATTPGTTPSGVTTGTATTGTATTGASTSPATTGASTSPATTGSTQPSTTSTGTSTGSPEQGEPDTTGSTGDTQPGAEAKDPYLWLEEVESEAALNWVKAQNGMSQPRLQAVPGFETVRKDVLNIANSTDRIPGIVKIGDHMYNYWRDANHVRGIWRRTTMESYRSNNTQWTTVLDLDKLAKDENENWVWSGAHCIYPAGNRCLVSLSRGGTDAKVIREFDTTTLKFVEDGFNIPSAKTFVSWQDEDHILVGTNFGEGSMTDSGYPRTTRRWTRGTKLEEAVELYAGAKTDVLVNGFTSITGRVKRNVVVVYKSFYDHEVYRFNANNTLSKYPAPASARLGFWGPWLTIELTEDWKIGDKTWQQGSFLIIDEVAFLSGDRNFDVLYLPDGKSALTSVRKTQDYILMAQTKDVKGSLVEWRFSDKDRKWVKRDVTLPGAGGVNIGVLDRDYSNDYVLTYEDHITPITLFLGKAGEDKLETLRSMPAFFDAKNLEVVQHFATSKDGTKIPYFQVSRKGMELNGKNPTILYGYGGFENAQKPRYKASVGKSWLERGGVYVVANIRGGGEYGPAWHRAALKEKRQNAFDDFYAVAEDLIARKVTESKALGIQGASNGGLLTGVALTQRPELFGAVVSRIPLLDMRRYNKLLAGASWVGEYGNPDKPEEWAYISKYSPYQNVKQGVDYPPFFLTTSTKDDRVHPAHARKMMAKMLGQGHADLYYYENIEGGHGGAANNEQAADQQAMIYAFFAEKLGLKLK